jgi:hypothetical protein
VVDLEEREAGVRTAQASQCGLAAGMEEGQQKDGAEWSPPLNDLACGICG